MNKNNNTLNISGITLIEILMAVIVLGVVMSIVTPMIIQSFNIVGDSSTRVGQNRMADIMLEDIGNYFKSAIDIRDLNSGLYEFDAYSPRDGIEKTYSIHWDSSSSELEFSEDSNLIRKLDSVNNFDISQNVVSDPYLYIFELSITNESGEIITKKLNLYARNVSGAAEEN